MQGNFKISNSFQVGLLGGLGVLTALVIGGAITTLANVITYVAAAIFIALGLEPIVAKLSQLGLRRQTQELAAIGAGCIGHAAQSALAPQKEIGRAHV